jgi:hypothetical protein
MRPRVPGHSTPDHPSVFRTPEHFGWSEPWALWSLRMLTVILYRDSPIVCSQRKAVRVTVEQQGVAVVRTGNPHLTTRPHRPRSLVDDCVPSAVGAAHDPQGQTEIG